MSCEPFPLLPCPSPVAGVTTYASENTQLSWVSETIMELSRTGASDAAMMVGMEVPLAAAAGYWYPGERAVRAMPSEWSSGLRSSLVMRAPLGCLYDAAGDSVLSFAAAELNRVVTTRFRVIEDQATFVILLEFPPQLGRTSVYLSTERVPFAQAIERASATFAPPGGLALTEAAQHPAYSTWYSYLQGITAAALEAEAERASRLGMRAFFIDDGWQKHGSGRLYAGCGDWVPDQAKFPDFRDTIASIQALDLAVVLWVAPLLVGEGSAAAAELRAYAPHYRSDLDCRILDPRFPEVQDFVAETCRRLVRDYGVRGLKIDFLDQAMVYADSPAEGDVGEAMHRLLARIGKEVADELSAPPIIEFRQPYSGPAASQYANVVRAGDCPADAVANRLAIRDTRLLSGNAVVHSDMMLWDPSAPPEAPAQQIMNSFFAVPQISVRLAELSAPQERTVSYLLGLWEECRQAIVRGQITSSVPTSGYGYMSATHKNQRVVGSYSPHSVVTLAEETEVIILNANGEAGIALRSERAREGTLRVCGPEGEELFCGETRLAEGLTWVDVPAFGVVSLDL